MATDTVPAKLSRADEPIAAQDVTFTRVLTLLLMQFASLQLTVALFAMAIFIILVGTLAQVDKNMWEVLDDYFRAWLAWIDLQVFFPRTWFPRWQSIPGGFYFPGGAAIGTAMFVNLLAAHSLRFAVQARGTRLLQGLAALPVGVVLTWLVIANGHNKDSFQGLPFLEWSTMWTVTKFMLALAWLVTVYVSIRSERKWTIAWWMASSCALGLGVLTAWLFYQGDAAALGDSSMRILWQLVQSTFAALVLLGACFLLFKRRAGIVLLHSGVGLVMLGELLVSKYAVEERMTIAKGQTVNFARDIRSVELAIIDSSHSDYDEVIAIPRSFLLREGVIRDEVLPFDIEVARYLKNSQVRHIAADEKTIATAGKGLQFVAEEIRAGSGADSSGKVDEASVYVRFLRKDTTEEIATYLLSQCTSTPGGASTVLDERITVDDKTYDVSLRFKRNYKSYSMHLIDVRKDDYLGTDTPMNYSSDVRLVDPDRNVDREIKIWMNNPLRYAGETFYQSGYNEMMDGTKVTDLQVVTNTGWMIPYVGCMLVATGMLFHFSVTLLRFLNRRARAASPVGADHLPVHASTGRRKRKAKSVQESATQTDGPSSSVAAWLFPLSVVLLCAVFLALVARTEEVPAHKMDLEAFGQLPVIYQGRVKPIDTLARNNLRVISDRETFKDEAGTTQPAVRWLLDVVSDSAAARQHKVFRIDNLDVLTTLGLQRRKRYRYAIDEFIGQIDEFEKQVRQARQTDTERLSVYQRKIIELDRRIRTYTLLSYAFRPISIPALPSEEQYQKDETATQQLLLNIREQLQKVPQFEEFLNQMQPPLVVPVNSPETQGNSSETPSWLPFATAWHRTYLQLIQGGEVNPATISWQSMLDAYTDHDVERFNSAVASYQADLQADPPPQVNHGKTRFEVFFNHFAPFFYCGWIYVVAFVLVALSWLGWSRALNRAALWLIVLTLAVHTLALISRIYISGRPPVTNLYSTAIFIGWGGVVLGVIIESVYRLGIGNIIASIAGFSTMRIAHVLAADGDTFTVLQAVLDTQFWLATHVVTINLGYATTFIAGMLGVLYVMRGFLTPSLSPAVSKELSRMIYGALCFSIFFSFVGTVLGGLWADDSWGRFWGWDPKENGALIIVLWNALTLHARWGAVVKERGLAVLAVGGNIVTAWSWFGVNELGVGLHSYGFTEGVLRTLALFIASQLAVISVGMLPLGMWWSFRRNQKLKTS